MHDEPRLLYLGDVKRFMPLWCPNTNRRSSSWMSKRISVHLQVLFTQLFYGSTNLLHQNGALAVTEGRDIIPTINDLLVLPFALKVATKDWHPANHISFASNHASKRPFSDSITIVNPKNSDESYESQLWPVHCVQGTPGAELLPELDLARIDVVIEKGQVKDVEMYSAFYDPLKAPRCFDSGLAGLLKEKQVTHCFVVGLAADYCVKATALDAKAEGFETYIVEEGTRAVDAGAWTTCKKQIEDLGVKIVKQDGEEVKRIIARG